MEREKEKRENKQRNDVRGNRRPHRVGRKIFSCQGVGRKKRRIKNTPTQIVSYARVPSVFVARMKEMEWNKKERRKRWIAGWRHAVPLCPFGWHDSGIDYSVASRRIDSCHDKTQYYLAINDQGPRGATSPTPTTVKLLTNLIGCRTPLVTGGANCYLGRVWNRGFYQEVARNSTAGNDRHQRGHERGWDPERETVKNEG